jgi:hypothetical protein
MALAARRFHANLHQMLFCKLNIVTEMTLTFIRKTRHNEDPKLSLQAGRKFTRIVNLMHKMTDRLSFDPEFIYCLMASPQWEQQDDALLPYALSETRQTLKQNLFARSPETEPDPAPTPLPTSTPESKNSPSQTLIDLRSPDPRPKVSALPPRPQFNAPKTADPKMASLRRPPTNGCPKNQREITEKLAKNISPSMDNNEEYQQGTIREKSSPKNRENLLLRFFRKWEKSGKLPGKSTPIEDNNKQYQYDI